MSARSADENAGTTRERGGRRVPTIDPELHKAARGGDLALLRKLLQGPEREYHVQSDETSITVASDSACEHNTLSFLSGVTHSGNTALHIAAYHGNLEVAREICNQIKLLLMQSSEEKASDQNNLLQMQSSEEEVTIDQNNLQLTQGSNKGETLHQNNILSAHSNDQGETTYQNNLQSMQNSNERATPYQYNCQPMESSEEEETLFQNNHSPVQISYEEERPDHNNYLLRQSSDEIETPCQLNFLPMESSDEEQTVFQNNLPPMQSSNEEGTPYENLLLMQISNEGETLYQNCHLLMQSNDDGETPLHYAAQAGNCELVALFIQFAQNVGSDFVSKLLRKRNNNGETALYQAILHCQVLLDMIKPYGMFGLVYFEFLKAKRAALVEAAKKPHEAVVEQLVQADSDYLRGIPGNQSIPRLASITNKDGVSPLYLAITQNSLLMVTSLIGSLPADASRESYAGPEGRTVLHAAAVRDKDFVEKVVGWKPELTKITDNKGNTPLHYASALDDDAVVNMLLKSDKYSAYIADSSGLYPIHVAAKLGHVENVAEFCEHCPDSDELLDSDGRNFLHLSVNEKEWSVVQWVCERDELVKAINSRDKEGNTPFHLAVKIGDIESFALLLGTGKANVCIMDVKGMTPQDSATANTTVGTLFHSENLNLVIERTLYRIGCSHSICRRDEFNSEHNLLTDKEKMENFVQGIESSAKSIAIGSTLIASATFAGVFTISVAYMNEVMSNHNIPGLSISFKAFVVTSAYAFICSIATTASVVESALPYLDPTYREWYLIRGANLVEEAIKGFIVAFALGILVILIAASQWRLGCLVCLILSVVPLSLEPQFWSNILLQRALIKYLGIKRFALVGGPFFFRDISYCFILLLVLFTAKSSHSTLVEQRVLAIIIATLLLISFPDFLPSNLKFLPIQLKVVKIMIDNRIFLIIILTIVAYYVLF